MPDQPPIRLPSLTCPRCGGYHLHQHVTVSRFRDAEDGPATMVFHAKGEAHVTRVEDDRLPHRRDSLDIYFFCESCHELNSVLDPDVSMDEMFVLRIYNHKGPTFMEWVSY